MDTFNIFALIGLIHCSLYFFHTILLLYCALYLKILRYMQLEIEVLRVKWYTTIFNQTIKNCAKKRKIFWHIWFDVGVCVTLLLLPISVIILIHMTTNIFMDQAILQGDNASLALQLVVPGFDIPMDELGYYIATLLACTMFHEMGHAISAISEDVRLYGLGFILAFIVPVAYVQICNDKLLLSPLRSKLRIMCAGVWHNCVLSIVAMIFLNCGIWLYKPFYSTETGVSVRTMMPNSPLIGSTGLMIHDTVYKINDCSVRNSQEWNDCILYTMRDHNPRYCALQDFVQQYDNQAFIKPPGNLFDCCEEKLKQRGHLCFEVLRNSKNINGTVYLCLPARIVITESNNFCVSNAECEGPANCLKPLLENNTKVVQIKRLNEKDVLFIGYPADIFRTVVVSNWVSKFTSLTSEIPEIITQICKYIVTFSSGLAIINVIPCFYFDGQYIVDVLIHFVLQFTTGHQRFFRVISFSTKVCGSLLLFVNLLYMLVRKLS